MYLKKKKKNNLEIPSSYVLKLKKATVKNIQYDVMYI